MAKIIERTAEIVLTIKQAAQALGAPKDWYAVNDYLDADQFDDVYHDGVDSEEVTKMNLRLDKFDGAQKIFAREVSIAMEDSERGGIASEIGNRRRKYVEKGLEGIANVVCEYTGENSNGDREPVSVRGGIESVNMDTPSDKVTIKIKNPEHLINAIVNGVGMFNPTIPTDKALSDKNLKTNFITNIGDYYDVFENKLSFEFSDDFSGTGPDDKYFLELLNDRLNDLSAEEVAEEVEAAVEGGRFEDINDAIALAAKILRVAKSNITKEKIKAELRKLYGDKAAAYQTKASKVESYLRRS